LKAIAGSLRSALALHGRFTAQVRRKIEGDVEAAYRILGCPDS
jgi:hypothetical protein